MSYYLLDLFGNIIKEYKTTIESANEIGGSPNEYSRCANHYEFIVGNSINQSSSSTVKGFIFVKKDTYNSNVKKIVEYIRRKNIYIIDSNGKIVSEVIPNNNFFLDFPREMLNKRHSDKYGFRIATKEYYKEKIKENPNYYSEKPKKAEYRNKGSQVDMYDAKSGDFLRNFKSMTLAAEFMGCSIENIRRSIKEERNVKGKYFFKLKGDN